LVNLVENWEVLEDYAGDKQGFYQILSDAEAVEIRVATGRLGFKKEFDNKGDILLNRILTFCKSRNFIKIDKNIVTVLRSLLKAAGNGGLWMSSRQRLTETPLK